MHGRERVGLRQRRRDRRHDPLREVGGRARDPQGYRGGRTRRGRHRRGEVRSGVTARLDGGKVVESGTPTADVAITVPDAVADPKPEPTPDPAAPSVTYAGHVQGTGDLPAVSDGATLGTTGESRRHRRAVEEG